MAEIERESMEYDVVIVGAGPAGLSAAIRLKQLDAGRCQLNSLAPRKWPVLERQMLAAPFQASKASIR